MWTLKILLTHTLLTRSGCSQTPTLKFERAGITEHNSLSGSGDPHPPRTNRVWYEGCNERGKVVLLPETPPLSAAWSDTGVIDGGVSKLGTIVNLLALRRGGIRLLDSQRNWNAKAAGFRSSHEWMFADWPSAARTSTDFLKLSISVKPSLD